MFSVKRHGSAFLDYPHAIPASFPSEQLDNKGVALKTKVLFSIGVKCRDITVPASPHIPTTAFLSPIGRIRDNDSSWNAERNYSS